MHKFSLLFQALTLVTPASSQILKSSVGTTSTRSIEPQYNKSVLPEIFSSGKFYARFKKQNARTHSIFLSIE